ncbi:MAG: chorismate synthase [Dehalococcoidia bacterium]|nr:chorismate synthase [Dehalococcoidia bacterium]
MSNSLGTLFRITSFGESHGPSVGIVVDGCPAGLPLTPEQIQQDLDRRRPSTHPGSTPRKEPDTVRILSGVLDGHTTGAPICMLIDNTDAHSDAYAPLADIPRPGHADYPARIKYGQMNDPRGGGRFSGRITAGFVMAGAVAKAVLNTLDVRVFAHTTRIGTIEAPSTDLSVAQDAWRRSTLSCSDDATAAAMEREIEEARAAGDSVGGIVEGVVVGLPVGLGEPVFSTVEGEIARALFAIPAVKAVEFGAGFGLCSLKGSQSNDPFTFDSGTVVTSKNDAGGVLGGLTTGMPLTVRVGIKPTPSISSPQDSINLKTGETEALSISGRHDACIVPRAVVVIEAMIANVLCDLALQGGFISGSVK